MNCLGCNLLGDFHVSFLSELLDPGGGSHVCLVDFGGLVLFIALEKIKSLHIISSLLCTLPIPKESGQEEGRLCCF